MEDGDGGTIFVDHILAEHRRLDRLIQRALRTFPGSDAANPPWQMRGIAERLCAIQTELAHHFRCEEQGGCLVEAVARCPPLAADVGRIEAQHDELLERLSELIDRCQTTRQASAWQCGCLEQEFRQIARELREHETLENRVMQRGFSVCLDAEIVEQDAGTPSLPDNVDCTNGVNRSESVENRGGPA
jgi:hypothetical protein